MSYSIGEAIDEYLEHLTVERGISRNTLDSYSRDLRRYGDYLEAQGITRLSDVAEGDVIAFLGSLREGDNDHVPLAPSSSARTVVAVRGLHRFAHREGKVDIDPARMVQPPTPSRRLPKALPVEQIMALLDVGSSQ